MADVVFPKVGNDAGFGAAGPLFDFYASAVTESLSTETGSLIYFRKLLILASRHRKRARR